MGQHTVGQSVTKVQVIRDEALYATSGHKGLGQQLCAIVERKQPEFKNQGPDHSFGTNRCISDRGRRSDYGHNRRISALSRRRIQQGLFGWF